MALPLLGAAFIGGIATKIVDTIVDLFTKKALIAAGLIAAFIALWNAFDAILNSAFQSIGAWAPTGWLATGFSLLPTNTGLCISVITTVKLARFVFEISTNILDFRKV